MGQRKPKPQARDTRDHAQRFPKPDAAVVGRGAAGGHVVEPAESGEAESRVASLPEVVGSGNGHASTDSEIGIAVRERLISEPPPRAGRLLVTVGDGVVTLSGEVDDQIERDRLLDLVRDVASVREVRDRMHVRKATRRPD